MVDDTSATTEEKDTSTQTNEEETSNQETENKNDAASHIIKRKDEKIAKLEQQLKEKGGVNQDVDISKIVSAQLAKEEKLKQLFEKYPGMKEREEEIREAAATQTLDTAVVSVFGLDGLTEFAAAKKAQADEEAKQFSTGGGQVPPKVKDEFASYAATLPEHLRPKA